MNPLSLSLCFFLLLCFFFITPSSTNVTLSISPKTLSKSGDPVQVRWCGVTDPSPVDWLGVYSPPDSPDDHFLGYIFLNSSSDYLSGSGAVTLPLPNLRRPYQFRLFRWNESQAGPARLDQESNPLPGTGSPLAASAELRFEPGKGPEQVHLSMTRERGQMRVMFVTDDAEKRFVRYGRKEGKLGREAAARAMTYTREDMCHAPANESVGWRDPGWIHDAVMTHLKGGERYYYQVGSDSKGWSKIFSFVSKNEKSDKTIAFLFGDMGTATPYTTFRRTQPESVLTMKWILRDIEALGDKPAFISHLGDISYARGYAWLWDHFFNLIEPVASRVPYHICVGNHDYDWPGQPWKPDWAPYKMDCGGECGVPFSLKFNMPGNYSLPTGSRAPATRNLFYSHDMGSVHFLYISTETNFLPDSDQYNFIKNDLESLDREKTPFVVVQGHRPMYTSSQPRGLILRSKMIEHLEPLFVDNKVTLILWGHVHRYERFCPLKNYTCGRMGRNGEPMVDALPVHIVIGMGGQDWQPTWETRPSHPYQPVFPQPSMSMYRTGELGYTRIVANEKKMTFSYVGNHDGQVHDRVKFKAPRGLISQWGKRKSVTTQ